MKHILIGLVGLLLFFSCSEVEYKFTELSGSYLGQTPPDTLPELFAPGIVNSAAFTRDFAMTPDGDEIYYSIVLGNFKKSAILFTKQINGKWTKPEVADFSRDFRYEHIEPFISHDGSKFLFVSDKPVNTISKAKDDFDIWVMDRLDGSWSEPYNLGAPVNTGDSEFFPTLTKTNTLYFTRQPINERVNYILRSKHDGGNYGEPEMLGPNVNAGRSRFNAFVDPDEEYLIIPIVGIADSFGGTDYYISFRSIADEWSEPINLGGNINTRFGMEYVPYVSPDKKYFFFLSFRESEEKIDELSYSLLVGLNQTPGGVNPAMYWVDAKFINELRPEGFYRK
ncbi:MAG: hypothetical protein KKA84_12350 [Bacteroidetes bacterium]|nr:hypothetical protein [Bacteroidota bacterium]